LLPTKASTGKSSSVFALNGHEVLFIAELEPGTNDETVLSRSRDANAVLLTADKDFGELVFRLRRVHAGVMLIRLAGLDPHVKAAMVALAFNTCAEELSAGFAVLSRQHLRLRKQVKEK
jgi:predicted nuclease of predicted toxin-antitoxin system